MHVAMPLTFIVQSKGR